MRALVLHPVRSKGGPRDPQDALAEAVSLATALDLDVVASETVPLPRARAGMLFGKGKIEELGTAIEERRDRPRHHRRAAVARAAAQPREGVEGQGPRPHRPHPRDLRRPRADPRGRAPGRARAPVLPEVAPRPFVDPPRAPAGRLRLPRRARRDPDRGRPPRARRAHRPRSSSSSPRSSVRAASTARPGRACLTRSWRSSATPTPASRRSSTA